MMYKIVHNLGFIIGAGAVLGIEIMLILFMLSRALKKKYPEINIPIVKYTLCSCGVAIFCILIGVPLNFISTIVFSGLILSAVFFVISFFI